MSLPEQSRDANNQSMAISIRKVDRTYRSGATEVAVLCQLDLDVARGEMVAVIGPSGTGKTTLLNIVAGLDRPDAGMVLIDGAAVGLSDRASFPSGRLSGGERQRVAIARALVGDRSILIADEPTGDLDAKTTDGLLDLLGTLRRERDLTILVATHDAAVAAAADRAIRLADGRLVSPISTA